MPSPTGDNRARTTASGTIAAPPQHACLPGHVAGVVADKIAGIEVLPQRVGSVVRQPVEGEIDARFRLFGGNVGDDILAARQPGPRGAEEVFQKLALPGVPDLGTGAADVGHGQQIQRCQVARVADPGGKGGNHLGVADVFLLRGARHHQMHVHQPGDQFAVGLVEAVLTAETSRIDSAEFGVVAAAALGNVVKQRGQIKQFGFVEVRDQPAGEREFVGKLGDGQTPHIAQHGEDVLVDGIDVKQVVLHLPDDPAKRRDVASEQTVTMHRAQRPGDAHRLTQQGHEQGTMCRIGAKGRVDAGAAAPQRAQCGRLETGERGVLGVDDEDAQQGVGLVLEQARLARFEQIGAQLEIRIDRLGRSGHRKQPHPQRLDQDVVGTLDQLGGPVITLHQAFTRGDNSASSLLDSRLPAFGAPVRGGGKPQARGELGLVIEGQAVVAPLGQQVQMDAQHRQGALFARDAPCLGRGEQSSTGDAVPAAADAAGLRQPVDRMQVAQAAGAVLQIGFEFVRAVVEAGVARLLLGEFAVEEMLGVEARPETLTEFHEQQTVAPQEARFEQIGFHRDVLPGLLHAGFHRAHAVANFQPDVPARLYPAFQRGLLFGSRFVRQEQQQVHVRSGEKLAAPVSPHGSKAKRGGQGEAGGKFAQQAIDEGGVARQVVGSGGLFKKAGGERRAAGFEPLAKIGERRVAHAEGWTRSGIAGLPADTVSTS